MADKIVLVSDDTDFFDYIKLKLELRKSDELFSYSFDEIPEKLHLLEGSLLIINSENSQNDTLELIKIFKSTPIIVVAYNDDETYKKKCYRAGAFDFIPLLTSDSEFRARILPALEVLSLINKNKQYREILVRNGVISANNEVFTDYENILDNALEKIQASSTRAVFTAIAPDEKSKFLLNSNQIETILQNNIRKNDILINYAPNKYFILLYNSDIKSAEKLWHKIRKQFSQKIYAGFSTITNQSRQKLISEVLNKLHEAITYNKDVVDNKTTDINSMELLQNTDSPYTNFKLYRQEFAKRIEQIITPVFYSIQQKYSNKLMGVNIEHSVGDGYGAFYIKGKHFTSGFRITSPGFSKINIDITLQKENEYVDTKRITVNPEEFEAGMLEDLLEQFLLETKNVEKEIVQ